MKNAKFSLKKAHGIYKGVYGNNVRVRAMKNYIVNRIIDEVYGGGIDSEFISVWRVNEDNLILELPIYDHVVTIDWGDGVVDNLTTHEYTEPGLKTIKINGSFSFNWYKDLYNQSQLIEILHWGRFFIDSYTSFRNANNLDLSNVEGTPEILGDSLDSMFKYCTNLKKINGLSKWKTEHVTSFGGFLEGCYNFNQPVKIDTLNGKYFYNMFSGCEALDSKVELNLTNAIDVSSMFYGCKLFNQPITFYGNSLKRASRMFYDCKSFNSTLIFLTPKCDTYEHFLYNCIEFNSPVNIDTSGATNLNQMFYGCTKFNQKVNFNTINATKMTQMFSDCKAFNQPINFNFNNVEFLDGMFNNAKSFNQPLKLNLPKATSLGSFLLLADSFNSPVKINAPKLETLTAMFVNNISLNSEIEIIAPRGSDFSSMFNGCVNLNSKIYIETENATNYSYMFSGCSSFDQDISFLNVDYIVRLESMLDGTSFSPENLDKLYNSWSSQNPNHDITFNIPNLKYTENGLPGRTILIEEKEWVITDGGLAE